MYAPNYGYVPGNVFNTSASSSLTQAQAQTSHHHQNGQQHQQQQQQPQPPPHQQQPQQQQQQQQQQQHTSFSAQQYGDPVAPSQLLSFGSVGNTANMALGPNSGMAHISSGNAVPSYQTPYSSSPYSGGIHTPSSNMAQNFTPSSNVPSSYGVSVTSPSPQNQASHLQSSIKSPTLTQHALRASPFASRQQNVSPNSSTIQAHLPALHNNNQHLPALISAQQLKPESTMIPQTANLPAVAQSIAGPSTMPITVNHESELRERERVTLLLNINKQLLLEVIRLQSAQQDIKDETLGGPAADGVDKEKAKGSVSSRYYFECMRRLQANLAYLAARADRNKNHNTPAHPQIMFAPTISPITTQKQIVNIMSLNCDGNKEDEERKTGLGEDRSELIKAHYKKLQLLFPNIDSRKDSISNPIGRAVQVQKQNSVDLSAQQRIQGEMYRAKIMNPQNAMQQPLQQQEHQYQQQQQQQLFQQQQYYSQSYQQHQYQ